MKIATSRILTLCLLTLALASMGSSSCHYHSDDDHHCRDDDHFDDDDCVHIHTTRRLETGEVVVTITDAPTADLLDFRVTVREIELVGTEIAPERLDPPTDGHRVELLSLSADSHGEKLHEILALSRHVRIGVYEGIRLKLVEPVARTRTAFPKPAAIPFVTDDEVLEVSFAEPLAIAPDELTRLVIDVDLEQSEFDVAATRFAPGGRRFRPHITVSVHDSVDDTAHVLADVAGSIVSIDHTAMLLRVNLHAGKGEITVRTDDTTRFAAAQRQLGDLSGLTRGEDVTLAGILNRFGELEASAVFASGTARRWIGRVTEANLDGTFMVEALAEGRLTHMRIAPDASTILRQRSRMAGTGDIALGDRLHMITLSEPATEIDLIVPAFVDIGSRPRLQTIDSIRPGVLTR